MSSVRTASVLLAILLAGLAIGYAIAFFIYTPKIKHYKALYQEYKSKFEEARETSRKLERQLNELKKNYEKLSARFEVLNRNYTSLKELYSELRHKYEVLEGEYKRVKKLYSTLRESYEAWRGYCLSYIDLKLAVKRALDVVELHKLLPYVKKIVTDPHDLWRSEKELYHYVVKNIAYAKDPPIPVPPTISELEQRLYGNYTCNELILSPSEVLKLRQGDCEDQAILLYALIIAYERYLHGKEYITWLVHIDLGDGSSHMAVAFPVKVDEGRHELTILDPAGKYYTSGPIGELTSRVPLIELKRYSTHWRDHGGIKRITIYDIITGELKVVVSGDIEEVAIYIEKGEFLKE
ncbi:MAG: hypothetical protein DRJ40_02215 [Thermoprotei archaeon]|nr:MAG: hypothetical protein DRJ40_02215 [Thermoprotei archaeon]